MRAKTIGVALILLLLTVGSSSAITIIDTGVSDGTSGMGLTYFQKGLAIEFTITEDTTITSIEGYLRFLSYYKPEGSGTIAIYNGNIEGNTPDQIDPNAWSEVYSNEFITVPDTPFGDTEYKFWDGWDGLYGLNWFLNTGTYVCAFEVRDDQTFYGSIVHAPLPNISDYAFQKGDDPWIVLDNTFAVRINGDINAPVPEPTTIVLLGIGLLGLAGMGRRRR